MIDMTLVRINYINSKFQCTKKTRRRAGLCSPDWVEFEPLFRANARSEFTMALFLNLTISKKGVEFRFYTKLVILKSKHEIS